MAWHLISVAGETENYSTHKEFQVDNASEISSPAIIQANEPKDQGPIPPGSFVYGPGYDPFYVKNFDGTWTMA